VPKLAYGLGLDLPNALARDAELLADLLKRVVGIHADAKTHAHHVIFPGAYRLSDLEFVPRHVQLVRVDPR